MKEDLTVQTEVIANISKLRLGDRFVESLNYHALYLTYIIHIFFSMN